MKTSLTLCLAFVLTAFAQQPRPLVVINGIPLIAGSSFADEIPIDQIVSLRTYEPTEATSLYGEFLGGNGIIAIKTRLTSKGLIDIPNDLLLTYGDAKPVVLLNGKQIEYETMKDIESEGFLAIESGRDIDFVKEWGPQAINGLVKIRTSPN